MHNVTKSVKFLSTSIRIFSFRGIPAIEFTICWSFVVRLTENIDLDQSFSLSNNFRSGASYLEFYTQYLWGTETWILFMSSKIGNGDNIYVNDGDTELFLIFLVSNYTNVQSGRQLRRVSVNTSIFWINMRKNKSFVMKNCSVGFSPLDIDISHGGRNKEKTIALSWKAVRRNLSLLRASSGIL